MKITLFVLVSVLQLFSICEASSTRSCSDKNLMQIQTNFERSYKKHNFFWDTLHCFEKLAMRGDLKAISSVIDLSDIGLRNAEYTEWHYELIEKLFLRSPTKFFDVMLTKDKKKIEYGMDRLRNPFDGETDAISTAAKKVRKNPKYRNLVEELIAK